MFRLARDTLGAKHGEQLFLLALTIPIFIIFSANVDSLANHIVIHVVFCLIFHCQWNVKLFRLLSFWDCNPRQDFHDLLYNRIYRWREFTLPRTRALPSLMQTFAIRTCKRIAMSMSSNRSPNSPEKRKQKIPHK